MTIRDLYKYIEDAKQDMEFTSEEIMKLEIAVDDGTEKSPIKITSISNLMDGYILLLTY